LSEKSGELFHVSAYSRIYLGLAAIIVGIFLLGVLGRGVFVGNVNFNVVVGGLFIIILAVACGLPLLYQVRKFRIFSVSFFEDYFVVKRWRSEKRFSYSEIDDLTLMEWTRPNFISMNVKGENSSLTLPRNPTNYDLESDLYSWLSDKRETLRNSPGD
jgi:hypothetical protein